MPAPEKNPTDPRPDLAGAPKPAQPAGADRGPNASGTPEAGAIPESTQENMGDGAGIRGDYGDAEQTNGLEGGPDQPRTDTELTGS